MKRKTEEYKPQSQSSSKNNPTAHNSLHLVPQAFGKWQVSPGSALLVVSLSGCMRGTESSVPAFHQSVVKHHLIFFFFHL